MQGLFGAFSTDARKTTEGAPITFPEAKNKDNSVPTFYIARMSRSNERYSKAIEVASRPFRRKSQLNALTSAESEEIMMKVFLDEILKGWENVQNDKGESIPFTKDNAKQLMLALPDLYDRLTTEANEIDNFRSDQQEADVKNS